MPEVPWNDTCTNPVLLPTLQNLAAQLQNSGYAASKPTDAESACNFVKQWYNTIYTASNQQLDIAFLINTVGGGGGASSCTTSNGINIGSCSDGYAKPSWQTA